LQNAARKLEMCGGRKRVVVEERKGLRGVGMGEYLREGRRGGMTRQADVDATRRRGA
jgi:hypothetical protein